MVLVSFSSKELVRKLDERRAAEDSYCSFEALELGFAALQSGRDGAEVGRQYGVHGGAQKRLWAEDHRLHGELLQQERLSDLHTSVRRCGGAPLHAATLGSRAVPLRESPATCFVPGVPSRNKHLHATGQTALQTFRPEFPGDWVDV